MAPELLILGVKNRCELIRSWCKDDVKGVAIATLWQHLNLIYGGSYVEQEVFSIATIYQCVSTGKECQADIFVAPPLVEIPRTNFVPTSQFPATLLSFPQVVPLYIFGESYGGKMAAIFALALNKVIFHAATRKSRRTRLFRLGHNMSQKMFRPVQGVEHLY